MDILRRFQGEWTFLDPDIPGEIIDALERFAIIIPDFSQNVRNVVNLGNTGHTLEVLAASEAVVRSAEERLNVLARTIFPYGGTDGLVNKMLWDVAVFGSPSIEAVIQPDKKGVRSVVIVTHSEIVFKYNAEEDVYAAYQKVGNSPEDYLELNPLTYYYAPLFQRRNSPYALPPMLAALSPLLNQLFMQENIRYVVKKIGLMGLIHAVLSTPPRKPQETEDQYLGRLKTYLSDVATDLTKNYRDGVMITYDEIDLKHFTTASNVSGVKDLFQLNEEQLASGMGTDPAMLGRTYSTTETYAGVVYTKMLKEIDNARRIVRRGVEKTYLLDLYLAGIPVEDINLEFNPSATLKPKEDAEIQSLKEQSKSNLYLNRVITLDEVREDLGYPPLEIIQSFPSGSVAATRRYKFNFQNGKYVFKLPHVSVNLKKKVSLIEDEERIENRRFQYYEKYLEEMLGLDEASREAVIEELQIMFVRGELPEDPDLFAEKVYSIIESRFPEIAHRQGLADIIQKNIGTIYTYYRLTDTSLWGDNPPVKTSLQLPDRRAQDFLGRMDDIFFSEYVQNEPMKTQLKDFLRNEVIEKGFQATDAVLDKFGNEWANNSDFNVRRIVDTSVTRTRTFAHIRQMKAAGIKELEIMEIMNRITCGMCREADGKIVEVAICDELVEEALNLSPEEFKEKYITRPATEREMATTPIEDLVLEGKGLPPLHPICRGRIRARHKESYFDFKEEHGLDELEEFPAADYSEHDKKLSFTFREKPSPVNTEVERKISQTIVCADQNPFGKKVYLTKEGIAHAIENHPEEAKERKSAIGMALSVVGNPDFIFLDANKGNDTKIYVRRVRTVDFCVVTKRVGPEVVWSAFVYDGIPEAGWNQIWQHY